MSKRIIKELSDIINEINIQTKIMISKGLKLNLLIHQKQSESYKNAMDEMLKSKFKNNINELIDELKNIDLNQSDLALSNRNNNIKIEENK